MNIRKSLLTPHAISAFAMTAALTFACVAHAVGIGELTLQSGLGEPLLAQVDLMVGSGERIEDSCLSLAAPDPRDGDTSGYLTRADLVFKTEGKRQYISISSRKPFNDAFARLRLQLKCPGTGTVIKTLTILPDLDAPVPQAPITAAGAPAETKNISVPPPADAHDITPAAIRRAPRNTQKHLARRAARPVDKRPPPPMQTSGNEPSRPASFRLKLSGEPIDESRIGKISAEERAFLLAQQKLLDSDDQMASFLAMQHQVKQLQDELGEIKLQLAQLGAVPSAAASSIPVASASAPSATSQISSTTGATQESRPIPTVAVKQPVVQQDGLRNGLFAAIGLVLAILALWLGLRYYTKIKSRIKIKSQRNAGLILKLTEDATATPRMAPSVIAKPPSQTWDDPTPAVVAPPRTSTNEETHPPKKIGEEATEADSMLEEAALYAAHGRPAKAIEILQEIIKRYPTKVNAWPLLLSIYSSLGNATEFEKTARAFLQHHKDSPSWSGMQALGRTLDRDNPLYADNNSRISTSPLLPDTLNPHRPIGVVLTEMGLLSKQDLQNCLDDFDPKKHGRFGGYLVARKAITLAQLDQALLQQQGVDTEAKPDTLPSLQDMENFLADFDPKRDGSVGEFLASRNAVTPEQLSHLLQQPSSHPAAAETPQTEAPSLLDKKAALDFVLETTSKLPVFDLEFEPATETNKPLDFEIGPSPLFSPEEILAFPQTSLASPETDLAFPEINLKMGNDNPPRKKPDTQ